MRRTCRALERIIGWSTGKLIEEALSSAALMAYPAVKAEASFRYGRGTSGFAVASASGGDLQDAKQRAVASRRTTVEIPATLFRWDISVTNCCHVEMSPCGQERL